MLSDSEKRREELKEREVIDDSKLEASSIQPETARKHRSTTCEHYDEAVQSDTGQCLNESSREADLEITVVANKGKKRKPKKKTSKTVGETFVSKK